MAIDTNSKVDSMALLLQTYAGAIKEEHKDDGIEIKDRSDEGWKAEFAQHGTNVKLSDLEEAAKLAGKVDAKGGDSFEIDDSSASTKEYRGALKENHKQARQARHQAAVARFKEGTKDFGGAIKDAFKFKDPSEKGRQAGRPERHQERADARRDAHEQNRYEKAEMKATKEMEKLHRTLAAQVARDLETREGVDIQSVKLGAMGEPDVFSGVYVNDAGKEVSFSFEVVPGSEEGLYAQFDKMQAGLQISEHITDCRYNTKEGTYQYSIRDSKGIANSFSIDDPTNADAKAALGKCVALYQSETVISDYPGPYVELSGNYTFQDGKLYVGAYDHAGKEQFVEVDPAKLTDSSSASQAFLVSAGITQEPAAPAAPTADQIDQAFADVATPEKAPGALDLLAQAYNATEDPATQKKIYDAVYKCLTASGANKIEIETAAIVALGQIDTAAAVSTLALIAKESPNANYKSEAAKSLGNLAGGDSQVIDAAKKAIATLPKTPVDLQAMANAEIPVGEGAQV